MAFTNAASARDSFGTPNIQSVILGNYFNGIILLVPLEQRHGVKRYAIRINYLIFHIIDENSNQQTNSLKGLVMSILSKTQVNRNFGAFKCIVLAVRFVDSEWRPTTIEIRVSK